jgi:hypothetical protein
MRATPRVAHHHLIRFGNERRYRHLQIRDAGKEASRSTLNSSWPLHRLGQASQGVDRVGREPFTHQTKLLVVEQCLKIAADNRLVGLVALDTVREVLEILDAPASDTFKIIRDVMRDLPVGSGMTFRQTLRISLDSSRCSLELP